MVALKGAPRLLMLASILCALVLFSAPEANAAEVSIGDDVRIGAGEAIPDDMYAQASQVTIDGSVHGDVVALADHVVINGTVDGSVWTLARTVQVNGHVGGSVRAVALSLGVGAPAVVDRDLVVGGYSLTTAPGSTIQGDLWAWTYQAQHAGSIGRSYVGRHTGLELDGRVGGDADVEVGAPTNNTSFNPAYVLPDVSDTPTVAPGLSISNQAVIGGELNVRSGESSSAAPNAFQQFTTAILNFGRQLLPLLLTCALILWRWPTKLVGAADTVAACPWTSFGWGIVLVVAVLIAVYCIAIVALAAVALSAVAGVPSLTLVTAGAAGVTVSALLLTLFVFWAWVSKVVFGVALMTWIARLLNRAPIDRSRLLSVVGTVTVAAIVAVTAAIPLAGTVVDSFIALVALGGLVVQGGYVVRPLFGVHSVSPRSAL
jgi:cytoskeletal protein CcmA (bactofilin family)